MQYMQSYITCYPPGVTRDYDNILKLALNLHDFIFLTRFRLKKIRGLCKKQV